MYSAPSGPSTRIAESMFKFAPGEFSRPLGHLSATNFQRRLAEWRKSHATGARDFVLPCTPPLFGPPLGSAESTAAERPSTPIRTDADPLAGTARAPQGAVQDTPGPAAGWAHERPARILAKEKYVKTCENRKGGSKPRSGAAASPRGANRVISTYEPEPARGRFTAPPAACSSRLMRS
jgi:hypothetical protein